jgi:hypothetical protein
MLAVELGTQMYTFYCNMKGTKILMSFVIASMTEGNFWLKRFLGENLSFLE